MPGRLEYSRLIDANAEDPSNGPINSVQFKWNAQLLLVAGLDQKLRFFFSSDWWQIEYQDTKYLRACLV